MFTAKTLVCGIVFCACTSPALLAESIVWSTSVGVDAQGVSTSFLGNAGSSHVDNSSSVIYTKSDQSAGFSFTMTGKAAANRGTLHSATSFQLTPPSSCSGSCTAATGTFGWGGNAAAHWSEYGVQAVGPQSLLSDIAGFKIIWNADGTFSGGANGAAAYLAGSLVQGDQFGGQLVNSTYDWLYGGSQQVSFILQPANPDAPFGFDFDLYTQAVSNNPAVLSAATDYYDTATLFSAEALDSSGNVLPGVELELGDGSLLGPSGLEPPAAATPEPSTWLLLLTAAPLLLLITRSKIATPEFRPSGSCQY